MSAIPCCSTYRRGGWRTQSVAHSRSRREEARATLSCKCVLVFVAVTPSSMCRMNPTTLLSPSNAMHAAVGRVQSVISDCCNNMQPCSIRFNRTQCAAMVIHGAK
jgi:hypothetical protein